MGQVIPEALGLASSKAGEDSQTVAISAVLSGSRVGGFLTTLAYLPFLHLFTAAVGPLYLVSFALLLVLAATTYALEKGVLS